MNGSRWNVRSSTLRILLVLSLVLGRATAEDCEVKLGAIGPMSGGAAAWGLACKAGAEFAAALANEEGGLRIGSRRCRVKVYSYDSLYTAAGGAAAANYLASENVRVTLGPVGAPESAGYRPVAKRLGQVNFSSSYTVGIIGPEFPLSFHALQSPITWAPMLIDAAREQFKFSSVLLVAPNDQGGTDSVKQLKAMYQAVGVNVYEEYFQRGTTNFGPLVQRILNTKPDVVELESIGPADAVVFVKALMEGGYSGAIGSFGGAGAVPIIQGAGGVEKLKAFFWVEVSPVDHPGIVKLKAEYERLMKAPPPEAPLFPVFALAGEVALQGISLAGTDQDVEKVAEALRRMTPESRFMGKAGWRGKTIYGINQELTFPVGLGMIANGKKLGVKTIAIPSE